MICSIFSFVLIKNTDQIWEITIKINIVSIIPTVERRNQALLNETEKQNTWVVLIITRGGSRNLKKRRWCGNVVIEADPNVGDVGVLPRKKGKTTKKLLDVKWCIMRHIYVINYKVKLIPI